MKNHDARFHDDDYQEQQARLADEAGCEGCGRGLPESPFAIDGECYCDACALALCVAVTRESAPSSHRGAR